MKANITMPFSETHPPMNFDSGRLSHAYIAAGSFADVLARAAVCSGSGSRPCNVCAHCNKASRGIHPDITTIGKTENKREIIVEQIRGLKRDVIIVPNESDKKVYIINDADTMNINAQNAFLRILEEPPGHSVFILRTNAPDKLLPTVRSRCVELKSAVKETPPISAAAAEMANAFFSAIQHGTISLTEFMFKLDKLDKEQISEFITAARKQASEDTKMAVNRGETATCKALLHAEQTLAQANEYLEFNVGVGHISGLICAAMMKGVR